MGSNGKYIVKERKIAREINRLQTSNRLRRQKYLEVDVKITALIHQLKGKYKPRKK